MEFARDNGAVPAPLNYRGYTKSICTSINHVVCHGIPNDTPMREGDIVNIDVTLIVDGWFGDSSRMYPVGEVSRKAERLNEVTYECLMRGIAMVRPGAHLGDIGYAIRPLQKPNAAPSCAISAATVLAASSMTIPTSCTMAAWVKARAQGRHVLHHRTHDHLGRAHVKVLSDGWTAVTRDRSLSAQFEHTIGVTGDGCEFFTLSPRGLHCPPYRI